MAEQVVGLVPEKKKLAEHTRARIRKKTGGKKQTCTLKLAR
jgi:hypothetical protein